MLKTYVKEHIRQRKFGTHNLAALCRGYLRHYNNERNNDMDRNGEQWLISRLSNCPFECIFDVGANNGDWAKRVCRNWPSATVHAFEPVPQTVKNLRTRFMEFDVRINNIGLSSQNKNGKMKFNAQKTDVSSLYGEAKMYDYSDEVVVTLKRGDSYCRENKIGFIDFLKVDTEGHDFDVLSGFGDFINKGKVSLIQFEHNEFSIYSKILMRDFYEILGKKFWVGRMLPNGILFSDYKVSLETFSHANYVAVNKNDAVVFDLLNTQRQ